MITLKQLLEQQTEFGQVPLADPAALQWPGGQRWKQFVEKHQIPLEANTAAENQLIQYLSTYFADESQVQPARQIAELLRKLQRYKQQYPNMLDPTTSPDVGEWFYRGTRLTREFLDSLDYEDDEATGDLQVPSGRLQRIPGPVVINPRGQRGFFSFSADPEIAEMFRDMGERAESRAAGATVPVLLRVSSTAPEFLFAPEAVHAMGGLSGELESIWVGDSIRVAEIMIPLSAWRRIKQPG